MEDKHTNNYFKVTSAGKVRFFFFDDSQSARMLDVYSEVVNYLATVSDDYLLSLYRASPHILPGPWRHAHCLGWPSTQAETDEPSGTYEARRRAHNVGVWAKVARTVVSEKSAATRASNRAAACTCRVQA